MSDNDTDLVTILEELRVHQVELEAQNQELRKSYLAHARSEKRFQKLFQEAPIPYVILNEDGIVLDHNLALRELLGLGEKVLTGHPFVVNVRPEFHRIFFEQLQKSMEDEEKIQNPVKLVDREKGIHDAVLVSTGIADSAGATYCLTAVLDRTALNEYRNLLRDQRERYERLLDHLSDAVFLVGYGETGGAGTVVEVNAAAAALIGADQESLTGRIWDSLFDWESDTDGAEQIRQLLRDRTILVETLLRRDDGETVPVEVNASVVSLGGTRHVLSVVRDITERRKTQIRIQRFQDVLESLRRANQVMLYETSIPSLAARVCRMLVESRGYIHAWMILFNGDGDVSGLYQHGLDDRSDEFSSLVMEEGVPYCVRRSVAEDTVIEINIEDETCSGCPARPTHGGVRSLSRALRHDGELYGVLTVALADDSRDDELERDLFSQLTSDLAFSMWGMHQREHRETAMERVEELLDEQKLMSRELKHRVKNDFALLRSLLSLHSSYTSEDTARAAIDQATMRLEAMLSVQEILSENETEHRVELLELCRRIIGRVGMSERGGEISLVSPVEEIIVSGALASHLGIILNELITNSRKYAGKGDVSVFVTRNDDGIELVVRDSGDGFPEEVLAGNRSGLGLDIVRALSEGSDGSFRLENDEQGGIAIVTMNGEVW